MALDKRKLVARAFTMAAAVVVLGTFILFLPKWCFNVLLAVIGVFGTFEFARICEGFGYRLLKVPVIFAIVYGIACLHLPFLDPWWLPYLVLLMASLISLIPPHDVKSSLPRVGLSLTASAYLGTALVGLAHLFSLGDGGDGDLGRYLTAFFILIVWAGDSAAYLAGSLFGRHKIAPVVSPKKTYEGTFANILGNLAMILIMKAWVLPQLNAVHIAFLTLVFGLLGFFGDLAESSWKRGSAIKDSGQLFPGHGGVMDRIDSIFLTVPIFYYLIKYVVLA